MCNLINIHTYMHEKAGLRGYVQFNKYTYIHKSLIPPWEDQCEWHKMTRMTGPDCAVMCNLINIHTYIHTYIHICTFASNSPALHHVPSGSKLRRFGGVGVGVYHSWRRSGRGRATNASGSSSRSHCVPKSDLPGTRCSTAGPPANPRRRPWTCQQHLHHRRGIYRLPRPGPGACHRCLRPGEPSVPS